MTAVVELYLYDVGRTAACCLRPSGQRECLCRAGRDGTELGWLNYSWAKASPPTANDTVADGAGRAGRVPASDGEPAVRLGRHPLGLCRTDMGRGRATRTEEWFLIPTSRNAAPLPRGPLVRLKTEAGGEAPSCRERGDVIAAATPGLEAGPYVRSRRSHSLPSHAAAAPGGKAVLAATRPGGKWSLFPLGGGDPRPVPALDAADEPLQWSADGRILYVVHRGASTPETAAEVHRVSVADGRRELFKTLTPPDPAGVDWVERVVLTPDGASYCYTYRQTLGTLYVAEGLR